MERFNCIAALIFIFLTNLLIILPILMFIFAPNNLNFSIMNRKVYLIFKGDFIFDPCVGYCGEVIRVLTSRKKARQFIRDSNFHVSFIGLTLE